RVEDSAQVRHYAPSSLRRVVALEPRGTVIETAGASSFRLAFWAGRPREDSMTTYSKIAIVCEALIVAMVAGRTAAPSAAESTATVQGVWRTLEVVVP